MSAPLNPSCPSGGQWFACTTGSLFVGCCNQTDACGSNGCSAGNLKPASFNSAAFGQYKDQQCPSASQWYTCSHADPPFMGCCKSNPCNNGCSQADLSAGILDTMNDKGYVTGSAASSTSGSSSMSATTTASSTATTTASGPSVGYLGAAPTTSAASQIPTQPPGLAVGAIVGIVVGGFAALVLIMGVIMCFCRRHSSESRERHSLMRHSDHPLVTEPAEFVYTNSKSPGHSSTHKPSPSHPHPYFDSPKSYPGTPPPMYGQQYAELGTGAHPIVPARSGIVSPADSHGLGMQFRTPRSRFSFAPSTPREVGAERGMTTVELPDTPVRGMSTPRV